MYTLWFGGREFCRCLLGPLGSDLSSSPGYPCLFSVSLMSSVDSGVLKSPTIIVWGSKSLCRSLRTYFMYLGAPVLGAHIFRIVSSSGCTRPLPLCNALVFF